MSRWWTLKCPFALRTLWLWLPLRKLLPEQWWKMAGPWIRRKFRALCFNVLYCEVKMTHPTSGQTSSLRPWSISRRGGNTFLSHRISIIHILSKLLVPKNLAYETCQASSLIRKQNSLRKPTFNGLSSTMLYQLTIISPRIWLHKALDILHVGLKSRSGLGYAILKFAMLRQTENRLRSSLIMVLALWWGHWTTKIVMTEYMIHI